MTSKNDITVNATIGYQPSSLIDADKIKTMDDVRLLFKAMSMQVNPQAPMYSELEHLFKEA